MTDSTPRDYLWSGEISSTSIPPFGFPAFVHVPVPRIRLVHSNEDPVLSPADELAQQAQKSA